MKTAKGTKKASAPKAPKTNLNINVEYVEQIADESIATIMALRALVRQLATELEEARSK
jgi:uncharacterized lipoprotein YmbA